VLADPSPEPGSVPPGDASSRASSPLEAELRRLGAAPAEATDAVEAIDRALGIVGRLATQHAVEFTYARPDAAAPVLADPVLLRQAVVGALVYAIRHAAGHPIALSAASDRARTTIAVRVPGATPATPSTPPRGELEDVGRLLGTQQGSLGLRDEGGDLVVELNLTAARPPSLLIVDDNPDMCQLYRRFLRGSGYQVIEARSGDAALALLAEQRPAGIVLDVMLPVRDGWDILQTLRGQAEAGDVPVLVCSVLQQRELALSLGATDFLAKPITQRALLEALARCCGRQAPARSGIPGRSASAR
jgi:CheY-like chemotaxis protein